MKTNFIWKTSRLCMLGIAIVVLSCSKDDDAPVAPVNNAPVIKDQSYNASEGIKDDEVFGTVTATDADKDKLSYSITANSDDLFEITTTGDLSLATGKTLDFETTTSYEITVEVTDGKAKAAAKITVTVTDGNDAPVINAQSFTVAEDISDTTIIGTVVATDPNGDSIGFSIRTNANDLFAINTDGEITLQTGKHLDYETATEHTLTIEASDIGANATGSLTATADITITVTNITSTTVTTFAGSSYGYMDGTGTNAMFAGPIGAAIDSQGNLFIAEYRNHRIRKITPDGVVSTFAGSGVDGFFDGTGTNARFNNPVDIAIDTADNLYVTDAANNRIRKITPAGVVSSFGTIASYNRPWGIAIDASGSVYVSENSGQRIRKINAAGTVVTIFAGDPNGNSGTTNGTGIAARFSLPAGLTFDSAGNLYVADSGNHRIRKITPAGVVSTFAGSGYGYADGTGTAARFNSPRGLTIDTADNLYVTDTNNSRIRKVTPSGEVSLIAGASTSGMIDGDATTARFHSPDGIVIDASGNLYIADYSNSRIRKITIEP